MNTSSTQLFSVGEVALLQSTDAPQCMWNAHVVITSARWSDNPTDIYGMPQVSTYVYEIDLCDRLFMQCALKKLIKDPVEIKEQAAIEVPQEC